MTTIILTNSNILYKQGNLSRSVGTIITFDSNNLEVGLYELAVYSTNYPDFITVFIHKSTLSPVTNYLYQIIQQSGFSASSSGPSTASSFDIISKSGQIYYNLRKL